MLLCKAILLAMALAIASSLLTAIVGSLSDSLLPTVARPSSPAATCRFAVVGAGAAGMAAGVHLRHITSTASTAAGGRSCEPNNASVTVFEAQPRLGGRAFSHRFTNRHGNASVALGAAYLHQRHPRRLNQVLLEWFGGLDGLTCAAPWSDLPIDDPMDSPLRRRYERASLRCGPPQAATAVSGNAEVLFYRIDYFGGSAHIDRDGESWYGTRVWEDVWEFVAGNLSEMLASHRLTMLRNGTDDQSLSVTLTELWPAIEQQLEELLEGSATANGDEADASALLTVSGGSASFQKLVRGVKLLLFQHVVQDTQQSLHDLSTLHFEFDPDATIDAPHDRFVASGVEELLEAFAEHCLTSASGGAAGQPPSVNAYLRVNRSVTSIAFSDALMDSDTLVRTRWAHHVSRRIEHAAASASFSVALDDYLDAAACTAEAWCPSAIIQWCCAAQRWWHHGVRRSLAALVGDDWTAVAAALFTEPTSHFLPWPSPSPCEGTFEGGCPLNVSWANLGDAPPEGAVRDTSGCFDGVVVAVPIGVLKRGGLTFAPPLDPYVTQAVSDSHPGKVSRAIMCWDRENRSTQEFLSALRSQVSNGVNNGTVPVIWHKYPSAALCGRNDSSVPTADEEEDEDFTHLEYSVEFVDVDRLTSNGCLQVEVEGALSDCWRSMATATAIEDHLRHELSVMLSWGHRRDAQPTMSRGAGHLVVPRPTVAFHVHHWMDDPFALGGISGSRVDLDHATDVSSMMVSPLTHAGRVVFAGEHVSGDNFGSLEGSVETGRSAAQLLWSNRALRDALQWRCNVIRRSVSLLWFATLVCLIFTFALNFARHHRRAG